MSRDRIVYDAIVVGAGISGLVSAGILVHQGCRSILLLDEYPHVGGNHIDRTIGNYTFDIGSLIFQDDSPLLRHFPELLPRYVPVRYRTGRLNPHGLVTQYPISVRDEILRAGPIEWMRIASSIALARIFYRDIRNAREYAEYWIGRRLVCRSGLHRYMERFYGVAPERIDANFARKRMYWIADNASIRRRLRRWLEQIRNASAEQEPVRSLVRPREGFETLYQAAIDRLQSRGVAFLLGEQLKCLQKTSSAFALRTANRRFVARRIISTIPVDRMLTISGLTSGQPLPTVTLISLFFSFAGVRGFEHSVLYNFSDAGAWKRLTMHSDFYGLNEGREFFTVEIHASQVLDSPELAEADFRRHVCDNLLFVGDLKLEGSHTLQNAYPIYVDQAEERAAEAIRTLRTFGVESFGRQGGFDYQPTARVSTLAAEAALGSQS
jgi:protoporphyrinogen oxidase